MSHRKLSPLTINDSWTGARGEWDGYPSIIRFRGELGQIVGHPDLSRRLTIEWDYEHDGTTGMPSSRESDGMAEFENAVVPALEEDLLAVLAVVITHNGKRQWSLYCSDGVAVQDRINAALASRPRLPISLSAVDDPSWQLYRDVVAGAH